MICKTLSALAVTIALLGSAGTTVAAKNSQRSVINDGKQRSVINDGKDICRKNPNNQHCHPGGSGNNPVVRDHRPGPDRTNCGAYAC